MSAIALLKPDAVVAADLSTMSIDELKAALRECCRLSATALGNSAAIIRELESRGENLDDMDLNFKEELRLMAYGQTIPEVVVQFAGKLRLLRKVAALPIPDQEKIAAGEPLKLVEKTPGGGFTHRMVGGSKLLKLNPSAVAQLFAGNSVRPEAEQILHLQQKEMARSRAIPKAVGVMKIDKERGGVVVGRTFIELSHLVTVVKILQGK